MQTHLAPAAALVCLLACGAESPLELESRQSALRGIDPDDDFDRCPSANPCITSTWNGTACVDTREPDGTSCFDGNVCDGTSTCRRGSCVSDGIPLRCEDRNSCTLDSCDPVSGCRFLPTTGNACSDLFQCTVADRCEAGYCVGHGSLGGVPTIPTLSNVVVSAPMGEIKEYFGVHYVEGESIDVHGTLPACAYVTSVAIDGRTLDLVPHTACDDVGTYDCERRYYEIVRAAPLPDGTLDIIVRIHFRTLGSVGDAEDVDIISTSAVGQSSHRLIVSRVADVVPANSADQRITLSMSETALNNAVVQGMYANYGDYGEYTRDGHTFKSPTYSGTGLDIRPDGIRFVTRVTLDETCNPSVLVDGVFHLVKTDAGIDIEWSSPPSLPITVDLGCNIVTLGIVDIVADFVYGDMVREAVDEEVQSQVDAMVGANCDALCRAQIQGFEYTDDELRVVIRPIVPSVVIDVPYTRLPGSFITRGFPVAASAPYAMLASGLATTSPCAPGSSSPVCGAPFKVDARGTFVWEAPFDAGNGSQIRNPWDNGNGPAAYFAQRASARNRLKGVYRPLQDLVSSRINGGAIVFRSNFSSIVRDASSPCGYTPSASIEHLAFGVNDAAGQGYGSGTRRVAVLLGPNTGMPSCF